MNTYHGPAFNSSTRDKILGAIILVIIVVALVWAVQYNKQINRDKWLSVNTYLSESYNINRDAPIKLAGIIIGKVAQIDLNENNQVRVVLYLDRKYEHYYVQNSTLETDSQIGVNMFLSGVSLNFVPGDSNERLRPNDVLKIIEPTSVSQLLDDWKLPQVSQQVSIIVDNLARISSNIDHNQQHIESLIINMKNTSESLLETSKMMPELMSSMQNMIVKVEQSVEGLTPQVNTTLKNLDQMLSESTRLMVSAQALTTTMNSAVQLTPATLESANATLNEMQALSRQVKNHWLLRSDEIDSVKPPIKTMELPIDASLYENSVDHN
tara:strand:+ start:5793 stop:6764 length:972 start_codon:yes stop_codon:yes gene_type:complete